MNITEKQIVACIRKNINKSNCFLAVLNDLQTHYSKPCNNISEFKRRSNKNKGDVFETFCVMYLKATGYDDAWLLKDTPKEVLTMLKLKSFDIGIDIVAKRDDRFFAVQSKYRKVSKNKRYNVLGWKELSTFYAYCARTGPWERCIVMTTCEYVRRLGMKNETDMTIGKKIFTDTDRSVWLKMIGGDAPVVNRLVDIVQQPQISRTEMRDKRAAYFEKLLGKNNADEN